MWRKKNTAYESKNVKSTVKYGGGDKMIWGSMAWNGTGSFDFINGIMNKNVYLDILKENLPNSKRKLFLGYDFVFQQDGNPNLTSHIVTNWLDKNYKYMKPWPPQSPDLNPIEHLWKILKEKISRHRPKSITELEQATRLEWENISSDVTENLVNSMPSRVIEVIKAKGGHTKY